jgi:hypothetical protein
MFKAQLVLSYELKFCPCSQPNTNPLAISLDLLVFVLQSLFESGMLDAAEQSQLAHPIEAAERRLELLGPVWKAPSLGEVLRQLPFMRGQSQQVIDFFIK